MTGSMTEAMIEMMKRHGLRRLRWRNGDVEVELEVSQAGFVIPIPVPVEENVRALRHSDDADRCPCGHSIAVEHNDFGCLHGCSTELCASERSEVPEPRPN